MKFKHATWRKLYRDEEGSFARLPWFARAAAAELLKICDDAGRIDVGPGPDAEAPARLAATAAFRMGATRGDRRLMAQLFPLLFDEGYLVWKAPFVVVRNFVSAQRRWDGEVADADHEQTTTEQRTDHEPTTTEQRQGHDGATKPELSTRKDTTGNASARARAHSSVPNSSENQKVVPPATPSAPAVELALTPDDPPEPKATPKPKLPFKPLDALAALAEGSCGRFPRPEALDLAKGTAIALIDLVRRYPTLDEWRRVGAWLAAGGLAYRTDLSVGWAASSDLASAMASARAWHEAGGGPVARPANSVVPAPDATPSTGAAERIRRLKLEYAAKNATGTGDG